MRELAILLCCLLPLFIMFWPAFSEANKTYKRTTPPKKKKTFTKRKPTTGGNTRRNHNLGSTIYIYRLKDGRKSFYVGQTVNVGARWMQHRADRHGSTPKQIKIADMYNRGSYPDIEVITKTNSQVKADSLERQYIKREGTHNVIHR